MKDVTEADSQPGLHDALDKYARFMDERSGIFASLREYQLPWESPIHVCTGELKPELCISKASGRTAISGRVCGAGATAREAKLSCIGEALERYSGIFRGDEALRMASYSQIADAAIHPDSLTLFSETQYANRDEWNRREGRHNWVSQRFDVERSIDWSPAWSLSEKRTKYLPMAYCYFGYPFDPEHDFCRPDSNGNAAGNSLDEAIVHGFLELVERECASVWWYNQVRRPRVDVVSFGSQELTALCNLHRLMARSVEVLDITADRNVPTFVAVSRPENGPREDYAFGFGAHFDARIALGKALTELTQFLPTVMVDRDPECFLRTDKSQIDMSFSTPNEQLTTTRCSSSSQPLAHEPRQEALFCTQLAGSWGLEMLVLDQTREDLGIPVVKILVPGMRSWWARFAPGRLYSLPIKLGWIAEPKKEAELNPLHLIL